LSPCDLIKIRKKLLFVQRNLLKSRF